MRTTALAAAVLLVLAACGGGETPAAPPAPSSSLAALPGTAELDAAAQEVCTDHSWVGVREGSTFSAQADELGISNDAFLAAVRRQCPDTVYRPLSQAEIDWCGDGHGYGQNYFRVVGAGVELDIESFSIVESKLVAKAANGVEMSDYEIELLTAELQTMTESSRFERDWAEACRTTF